MHLRWIVLICAVFLDLTRLDRSPTQRRRIAAPLHAALAVRDSTSSLSYCSRRLHPTRASASAPPVPREAVAMHTVVALIAFC